MPRLAVLSPLPPYPPRAGGTVHMVQAIHQLAKAYEIHLDVLAPDPEVVAWGPLEADTVARHAFPHGGSGSRLRPWDPPAALQEYSSALAAHIRASWQLEPVDVVQLEFTTMAQYAPFARSAGAWVVCMAHNVAFLAQLRRARREHNLALAFRRWVGAFSLWAYEIRTLRACDLVITLGEPDRIALQRWLPSVPIVTMPSGVDLSTWPVAFRAENDDEILFVGSYRHPPNLEGALWLATQVWPRVRQQHPSARLTLAGQGPPPELLALAGPDIRVPGMVPNLRPLYERAALAVAPIFWGAGVRIKLLEALAAGMPIVTTAAGAEGLDLLPEEHALFAESPADFAAAIVRLLNDRDLRARFSTEGRTLVERKYDWNLLGPRLVALYEERRMNRS